MKTRVFQRGLSVLAVLGMTMGLLPAPAFASGFSAPSNVSVVGGKYTNDTTPTFTWDRPANATWYEVAIDDSGWIGLSNVSTYTSWTLSNGWHGFYVRAHDNSGHTSTSGSVVFEIDTQGASIPGVTPTSAHEDESVTFSVTPSGEAAVTSCELFVNNGSVGTMAKYGNTFRKTYTFAWAGSYSVYAGCWDGDRNYSTGTVRTVTVDARYDEPEETFSVGTVSPASAMEDESVTMRVSTSGTLDADSCLLYVNGSSTGYMNETSSNSFSKSYTFTNDGSYTVYAYCEDENGTWSRGSSRSVTVSNHEDDETFWVNTVSPSSATEDEEVTMKVTTGGTLDTDACLLYVNSSSQGYMDEVSSNAFEKDYTFSNDGSYTVYAYCEDENGNWERGSSRTVTVANDDEDDTDTFWVNQISPSSATEDDEVTIKVTTDGALDADSCLLYVDGDSEGYMDETSSNHFEMDYTFRNDGSYSVYAYCEDENGYWQRGNARTVTVDNEESGDGNSNLTVPRVSPSSADEDERTEFTVKPSGDYNITECWLYVDGDRAAEMNEESTNYFTADYTFHNSGSYSVYAYCKDSHGNTDMGDKRTISVNDSSSDNNDDDYDDEVSEGSLIKTACGHTVAVNDPCTAVYYYGEDGKRHVFPNASVYFTWYNDFDDVVEVSSSFMSSLTIGKNVTYRPGSVLVKFEGSSSIYAVERKHTLRRYTTTSLMESDYGSNWEDALVEVSDSLYSNYTIGSVIDSTSDFDRTDEYYSVETIDDVL